ncbi:PLC-like phosphodiesterase, partial [Fennellomyces sp. T-0311]
MVRFSAFAILVFLPRFVLGTLCNGHESLCSRTYNEVTYLITHDSYAHGDNVAATQNEPILQQLNKGVRGLKFSAVLPEFVKNKDDPRSLHLCHTSCTILDAGSAVDTLNQIAAWLKENPGEVVTIFWNNLYNLENRYIASAYQASSIMPYIYTFEEGSPWPTLKEMIDSGKRLVNFVDSGADPLSTPWLMDEFANVFETPYDNTNIDAFNCVVDRPASLESTDGMMYVVNHFLYGVIQLGMKIEVPQRDKAANTNGQPLEKHVTECSETFKRKPNFIEVDFYEQGATLDYVAALNGVSSPIIDSADTKQGTPKAKSGSGNTLEDVRDRLLPSRPISHVLIDNITSAGGRIEPVFYAFSILALAVANGIYK